MPSTAKTASLGMPNCHFTLSKMGQGPMAPDRHHGHPYGAMARGVLEPEDPPLAVCLWTHTHRPVWALLWGPFFSPHSQHFPSRIIGGGGVRLFTTQLLGSKGNAGEWGPSSRPRQGTVGAAWMPLGHLVPQNSS